MLVTVYKIGKMQRIKRFTAASSRCRQNVKDENFTSVFGKLRQTIAPKSVQHVQLGYVSSFSQSNH